MEDDKLEPIGPPSLLPQEKLRRKAETIKVTCCQVRDTLNFVDRESVGSGKGGVEGVTP